MDTDVTVKANETYSVNVKYFRIKVNGDVVAESVDGNILEDIQLHKGDVVTISKVIKKRESRNGEIILNGFTEDDIVSDDDSEEERYKEEIIVRE
jgi:hypothetical protein